MKASATERTFHDCEDRVVLDKAVHQQDGRRSCVHVVMNQSTLFGTEAAEIVAALPTRGMRRRR